MTCGIDFYADTWYLIVRFLIWFLVLATSSWDFFRHRGEDVYGWQLHACIFSVIVTIVVKEGVSLIYQYFGKSYAFCMVLIFFDRLVAASYITVLMLISYGWKITHDRLGDNAKAMLVAPVLFLLSSLVHEYTLQVETDGEKYFNPREWSKLATNLILISSLVWIFTVIYMLLWIYQTVKVEKIVLIEKIANDVSHLHNTANSEEEAIFVDEEGGASQATSTQSIPQVDTGPVDVLTQSMSGDMIDENTNAVMEGEDTTGSSLMMKTFDDIEQEEEESDDDNQYIPNTAKLTLLTRYFLAVTMYFLALCFYRLVLMVNLGKINFAALVFHDFVFVCFTAALAYIFRLREQNPYFMVAGYENIGNEEDILHEINVGTLVDSDDENDVEEQNRQL